MLGSEQDPSIDDLRGRLERSPERLADGKGAEFVIADARTDEFVGAVNLFALDWHSRRGEVGIWLRQRARGRGLASAALALMLDWVFDSLELERVEMTTIPDNEQPLQRAIRGRACLRHVSASAWGCPVAARGDGGWPVGHDGAGVAGAVRPPRDAVLRAGEHCVGC